ncbi:MAG: hypothetical protein COS40_04785, partial [Deltaproteobacteria bacterium CG03_land_8_20_14_0_80_45_14]
MKGAKFFSAVICGVFLLGVGLAYAKPAQKVFKINLASTLPLGHHLERACYEFAKVVKEKTEGRVLVTVYPAGQLYKDKDLPEVIPTGACDMGMCNSDVWTGRDAALGLLTGNSFLFDGWEHCWRWSNNQEVRAALDATFKRFNCKFLGLMDYGTSTVIAKKKFLTVDDWKGTKLRAAGEIFAKGVMALGARPTVISSAEQYDALMKGVVDGVMTGPSTFVLRKLYEGAKYPLKEPLTLAIFVFLMNLDLWKSMPADIQAKVGEAARHSELWA